MKSVLRCDFRFFNLCYVFIIKLSLKPTITEVSLKRDFRIHGIIH